MLIFVKTLNGKRLALKVESSGTIKDVKLAIQQKESIPEDRQHLSFGDKPLQDDQALSECNICTESLLQLDVRPRTQMPIDVELEGGKSISLEVERTESIGEVKRKIQDKTKIPVDQQRLLFGGKHLNDKSSLSHYKIGNRSKLRLEQRSISDGPIPALSSGTDVFISYHRDYLPQVRRLKVMLADNGYSCWIDTAADTELRLRESRVVVACISAQYTKSPVSHKQIGIACSLKKPIILLMLEKVPWPPQGPMGTALAGVESIPVHSSLEELAAWTGPCSDALLEQLVQLTSKCSDGRLDD